jgi:hypothetical protein
LIEDGFIRGQTGIGRATSRLLQMNAEQRVHVRRQLLDRGEF